MRIDLYNFIYVSVRCMYGLYYNVDLYRCGGGSGSGGSLNEYIQLERVSINYITNI